MASFLSKLFKPKWQHASSEVRKNAIADLNSANNEEQQTLVQLMLNDAAADVRIAALKRLSDPATIIKHYASLKEEDKSQALEITAEQSKQLGLSLFDLIQNDQLLAEIIIASESQNDFMNGLARLQDEQALLAIASKANLSRVRQAATELIETEQNLQQVIDVARSKDKNVFQIAKAKLSAIRERKKLAQEQREQLLTLLSNLREHASTEDTNLYSAKLESLTQKWVTLSAIATEDETKQYQDLFYQCDVRSKQLAEESKNNAKTEDNENEVDPTQPNDRESNSEHSELSATLHTLNDTLDQLRKRAASAQEVSAIDAIIKTQETRWIESTKAQSIDKLTEKTYNTAMGLLRRYHNALQKLTQQSPALESLLDSKNEDSKEQLGKIIANIDWPENFERPDVLARAMQQIASSKANKEAEKQRQDELENQFERQLMKLDASLEEKQLASSKKQMQLVRKTYGQLDKRRQNSLAASLKLRSAQLNELRDWQGFAASPQQERLCEAMEQLIEQHLDPQDKAGKIKSLQDEWKSLGGAQDQSLWERFSSASDTAFEPCAEFYSQQSQVKSNNLSKRAKMLEELSAFVEQNNWENPDWKGVEKINRQARNEWRDAYPVDHKKSRSLQEKFNAVLEKLDEKLASERARNLALKEDIVARAQALAESDDLNAAMQGAKNLQNEWQQVGITEHKKDRALWKAFRKSCDAIFERRDEERNKAKDAEKEQRNAARSALDAAKELVKEPFSETADAESALAQLRKEIKQLGDLPATEKARLYDQYDKLIAQVKVQLKRLGFQQVINKWSEAERKAVLAYTAFAQGELDASKQEFVSTMRFDKSLESHFKRFWQDLGNGKVKPSDENAVKELCIRCEIAAGVSSPEQDQERRMQLQVSRLSEGLSSAGHQSREEQLEALLTNWYADMLISNELREVYERRIKACISAVFGAHEATTQESSKSALA
jgi:hypothetical protein